MLPPAPTGCHRSIAHPAHRPVPRPARCARRGHPRAAGSRNRVRRSPAGSLYAATGQGHANAVRPARAGVRSPPAIAARAGSSAHAGGPAGAVDAPRAIRRRHGAGARVRDRAGVSMRLRAGAAIPPGAGTTAAGAPAVEARAAAARRGRRVASPRAGAAAAGCGCGSRACAAGVRGLPGSAPAVRQPPKVSGRAGRPRNRRGRNRFHGRLQTQRARMRRQWRARGVRR